MRLKLTPKIQQEVLYIMRNEEADQIRAGALRYVNEIMEDVQGYVASVKEAQESVFNQLLSALDSDLASIKTNAKEIEEQLSGVSIPQARTRTVEDSFQMKTR